MTEYVFRYAHGFGGELDECDHTDNVDHFGTLHEEIVRCRDCKHMEVFHPFDVFRLKPSEHAEYHCTSSQFSNWDFPIEVDPDGYCAWGERKDGSE